MDVIRILVHRWYSKRNLDNSLETQESPLDAPPVPIPHSWSASGREGVDYNMNMALDPVISLQEMVEMLEDFLIIPQFMRRSTVKRAFYRACGGASAYETRRCAGLFETLLLFRQSQYIGNILCDTDHKIIFSILLYQSEA